MNNEKQAMQDAPGWTTIKVEDLKKLQSHIEALDDMISFYKAEKEHADDVWNEALEKAADLFNDPYVEFQGWEHVRMMIRALKRGPK